MWYKLSGKTNMAIWITLSGLAVTAVVIILFMPKYSYWAAAFGHLASYIVMFIISSLLGAKHYPIPYRWSRLGCIFILMGLVYGISLILPSMTLWLKLTVHTLLLGGYLTGSWTIVRR